MEDSSIAMLTLPGVRLCGQGIFGGGGLSPINIDLHCHARMAMDLSNCFLASLPLKGPACQPSRLSMSATFLLVWGTQA